MVSGIEILLAWFNNFQVVFFLATFATVLAGIFVIGGRIGWNVGERPENEKKVMTWGSSSLVALAVLFALLTSLPSVNDLWKIRIAFIKLELASPQNVQKAVDHIEDVGAELECKFLGHKCPKTEKEKRDEGSSR